jgi:hypothetical protein
MTTSVPELSHELKELLDFYEISDSNVTDIRDAQVICFGENHAERQHQETAIRIMQELRTPHNDVLLYENVDSEAYDALVGVVRRSWDLSGLPDNQFYYWNRMMEHPSGIDCIKFKLPSHPDSPIGWGWLCKTMCCWMCYGAFVCCFKPCVRKWATIRTIRELQALMDECPKRNASMRQAIAEAASTSTRVFVNAGAAHLREKDMHDIDCDASNQSVRETMAFLKQSYRFTVLIPKNMPVIW